MSRGKPSGISLSRNDAKIVLGMEARGDRNHDIAAWFGVNQGRIAECKDGSFGNLEAAPPHELPPSGPPGLKGRRLRTSAGAILGALEIGTPEETARAQELLRAAIARFDANEG
jgi:hypothetical protein